MPPEALLSVRGLAKGFGAGPGRVEIFRGLDLEVFAGDFLSIVGPSGCGKSTLLHLFAGLDEPDAGEVSVSGTNWRTLSPEKKAALRGEAIGFVFQLHHLLPELTAEENVALPLFIANVPEKEARTRAREGLSRVGLLDRAGSLPRTLSGGERQRVAIARAVIRRPRLLFCDEPTGSLDAAHAREVFTLLTEVSRERAGAVILVTHDPALAASCERQTRLAPNGLFEEDEAVSPGGGSGDRETPTTNSVPLHPGTAGATIPEGSSEG